jgi:hypothetical protein
MLAAFAFVGIQGLRGRRAEYEYVRVTSTPFASADRYLSQYDLSSGLLDRTLADVAMSEPLLFVRRHDAHMFEEFSILSYATWPRRLYAVGCGENGKPEYIDFAPLDNPNPISVAIVESAPALVGSAGEAVQKVAPTTWLIRASPGQTWSSFCR